MPRNLNNISDLIVKFEARDHYENPPGIKIYKKPKKMEQNEEVVTILSRFGRFLDFLSHLPLPRMSVTGMGITFLSAIFIFPRAIVEIFLFPTFRLLFGTLYPAYASYKAVRTKNVKEYVKWMMYWIVYAFFTCIETFTDIFLSWFPFYYEIKVILVIWLLSPATRGSSTLYRKFVHPMLTRREQEIDEYLNQAKEKGYTTVLQLGSKGMNYATSVIMQTAIKGGGNLVQTLRKSYSLSDLSEPDTQRTQDEIDEITRPQKMQRVLRPRTQSTRSASGGRNVPEMYFPEVDVSRASRDGATNYNYIRSNEDISSGYSSAEPMPVALSRTASLSHATRGATRLRSKRPDVGEKSWEEDDGEGDDYPYSPSYPFSPSSSISSYPQFRYSFDGGAEPLFLVEEENSSEIDEQKILEITKGAVGFPEEVPDDLPIDLPGRVFKEPTELDEKYRLFEMWLKTQQNSVQNPSNFSEDFRDTFSETDDDEEFHEPEGEPGTYSKFPELVEEIIAEPPKEVNEIPEIVSKVPELASEVVPEIVPEIEKIEEDKTDLEIIETTPFVLSESLTKSENSLDNLKILPEDIPKADLPPLPLKKSPSHGKGKAPEPPTLVTPSPTTSEEVPEKKSPSVKSKLSSLLPGLLRSEPSAKMSSKIPKETPI
ncbi:Receptor expression-enhancing protein [Sergentomyia squamirostris]